jgi:membrane protein implicated in regulation of membrane protease activity
VVEFEEVRMNKFLVALGAYALLATLAWTTLSEPKFKFATLAVLALFALRTWSWHKRLEQESREHHDD